MQKLHKLSLCVVGLVVLAGCASGGEDNGEGDEADGEDPSPEAAEETSEVVAETEWGYERDAGSAQVQIHPLDVHGDLMELTVTITADDPPGLRKQTLTGLFRSTEPYLVDDVTMNRHLVVEDTNGDLVRTDNHIDLPPGEPTEVTFVYAAPPEDVQAMDLYATNAAPVTDIPVLR